MSWLSWACRNMRRPHSARAPRSISRLCLRLRRQPILSMPDLLPAYACRRKEALTWPAGRLCLLERVFPQTQSRTIAHLIAPHRLSHCHRVIEVLPKGESATSTRFDQTPPHMTMDQMLGGGLSQLADRHGHDTGDQEGLGAAEQEFPHDPRGRAAASQEPRLNRYSLWRE